MEFCPKPSLLFHYCQSFLILTKIGSFSLNFEDFQKYVAWQGWLWKKTCLPCDSLYPKDFKKVRYICVRNFDGRIIAQDPVYKVHTTFFFERMKVTNSRGKCGSFFQQDQMAGSHFGPKILVFISHGPLHFGQMFMTYNVLHKTGFSI